VPGLADRVSQHLAAAENALALRVTNSRYSEPLAKHEAKMSRRALVFPQKTTRQESCYKTLLRSPFEAAVMWPSAEIVADRGASVCAQVIGMTRTLADHGSLRSSLG